MKLLFTFLIAAVCLAFMTSAQTTVPGGAVSGTWTLAGSPYQVQGDISIPDDSTLTIMPGVTVSFQSNYQLQVLGRLLAVGTNVDTITFTAADTSIGWQSIRFTATDPANDTSKIIFCKLEYGKASDTLAMGYGGAISITYFSKAVVSNCLITECYANAYGAGIYCFNSSPIIIYNLFTNNRSKYDGCAIECDSVSSAVITNNIVSFNTSQFGTGAVTCNGSDPLISNNIITYNVAGGGGGISCAAASPVISYNIISNNATTTGNGGGIICETSSNPFISNNTITNNFAHDVGGGIFCVQGSAPTVVNNTIANNQATNLGGALYCLYSSPSFYNCILWGNTAAHGSEVGLLDSTSTPNFYYCDVQGDSSAFGFTLAGGHYSGAYTNNIDTNPLFVSPSGGSGIGFDGVTADWSLQSGSHCINAGDPIYGPYPSVDLADSARIRGCIIDMGAYEFQQGLFTTIPTPVITIVGDTLFCSTDTSYDSYQWYADTTLIPGATDSALVISQGGNYNVQVSNRNGCMIAVGINIVLGLQNYAANNMFSLSPNPVADDLLITGNRKSETGKLSVVNMLGEIIYTDVITDKPETISCKLFPAGIYFVQVISGSERWVGKFVKE